MVSRLAPDAAEQRLCEAALLALQVSDSGKLQAGSTIPLLLYDGCWVLEKPPSLLTLLLLAGLCWTSLCITKPAEAPEE